MPRGKESSELTLCTSAGGEAGELAGSCELDTGAGAGAEVWAGAEVGSGGNDAGIEVVSTC